MKSRSSAPRGVLLLNLGTPDAPTPAAVRRYLREFLSDPRVLDMNPLGRWLLLNLVILRTRPRRSAAAYRQVWSEEGSPLAIHGAALQRGVAERLGPSHHVELAMRYGKPSIGSALDRLREARCSEVVVLPLFPQYSAAATSSAVARVYELCAERWDAPIVTVLPAFFDDPGFIAAVAGITAPKLADFAPDHVLFSYHGLPERQIAKSDPSGAHCLATTTCCDTLGQQNAGCYRAQCMATTRALVEALGLDEKRTSSSFQSRLGRTPWIRPYTDERLPELARQGVERLAVLCPAFVADCLETLEEIGLRAREQWRELGGKELLLVPCPNSEPRWIEAVAEMVTRAR